MGDRRENEKCLCDGRKTEIGLCDGRETEIGLCDGRKTEIGLCDGREGVPITNLPPPKRVFSPTPPSLENRKRVFTSNI